MFGLNGETDLLFNHIQTFGLIYFTTDVKEINCITFGPFPFYIESNKNLCKSNLCGSPDGLVAAGVAF